MNAVSWTQLQLEQIPVPSLAGQALAMAGEQHREDVCPWPLLCRIHLSGSLSLRAVG